MKKKLLTYLLAILLFVTTSIGAGGSGGNDSAGKRWPPTCFKQKYRLGYKKVERANKLKS